MAEDSRAPRVFISYAHESDEHVERVRDLWLFLRGHGVDAKLDRVAAQRRQDWTLWIGDQIRNADHILVIASSAYRERAEGRTGPDEGKGVQWEARMIRDAFHRDQRALDRFVPVVLPGQSVDGVPDFLTPSTTTVYHVPEFTLGGVERLLRLLLDAPAEVEPPLKQRPDLRSREHTLSTTLSRQPMRHALVVRMDTIDGQVHTQVLADSALVGDKVAALPPGLGSWRADLDSTSGHDRLTSTGQALWEAMFDEPTSGRLVDLIAHSPVGSVIDIVVHLAEDLSTMPVELLRLPDGRLAATTPGVRVARRLDTVEQASSPPPPGPLKILAAVAAPEETATPNPPLDVEAEMQALLDAVTDLDLGLAASNGGDTAAQVKILEVASLDEIGRALAADQYHVLHLSAHGSDNVVELEDEDGDPVPADADRLVAALRAGERPLPLVVLSSCRGAAGGTAGLAAALVRHGAERVIAMQTSITDTYATELARDLYTHLARTPDATASSALATARRQASDRLADRARKSGGPPPRPESAIPTLIHSGVDGPLRATTGQPQPLERPTLVPGGTGLRELPLGRLIGRRRQTRTAMSALRGTTRDREKVGDWAGVVLTGIGGIGKTAVAGRIATRAREQGWTVAEHVGVWNPDALADAVAEALTSAHHGDFAAILRAPEVDTTAKIGVVVRLLATTKLLLLFDDFEQNLDPEGRFHDPGFAELFGLLCDNTRAGRLLVTCRHPVPDGDTLLRVDLPPLSPAEQRRLFLRLPALRTLSTEDRQLVNATIGGHPRLLEFLDVLLRKGTAADFRHITTKLRDLARHEHIDLRPNRDLTTGIADTVRLGTRDILLSALLAQLTPDQHELTLQASLARASLTLRDLAHTRHGPDPTPQQLHTVDQDVERLRDLTLLATTTDDELLMHPWVAASLTHTDNDLIDRHRRGAAMRKHRLSNTAHGRPADITEYIRHLAGSHDYDRAVATTFAACNTFRGQVAIAALLAEITPLIPTSHAGYLALADRECQALIALGLATATAQRLHNLHTIAVQRAVGNPDNAGYQRDLSISHDRLGDLAVARGDTNKAEQHYQTGLGIAQRLVTADPDNAEYQRDLSISHDRLGELAVARGDTNKAEQHYQASLDIRERLTSADPDNAEYQRDLSISHNKLGDLAVARGDTNKAEQHYQTGLGIAQRLATADPDNAEYQRDLSISHNKLGDLAVARG
ncbi:MULTISPECIES: CHAT domain-containing protein, partial [unclassified Saccharothrix]|uniref:CHAT domain-containing protein n=1 Tax=unclassified Saccharothrix TaxID=2593673 RepID=UPI00307D667A